MIIHIQLHSPFFCPDGWDLCIQSKLCPQRQWILQPPGQCNLHKLCCQYQQQIKELLHSYFSNILINQWDSVFQTVTDLNANIAQYVDQSRISNFHICPAAIHTFYLICLGKMTDYCFLSGSYKSLLNTKFWQATW